MEDKSKFSSMKLFLVIAIALIGAVSLFGIVSCSEESDAYWASGTMGGVDWTCDGLTIDVYPSQNPEPGYESGVMGPVPGPFWWAVAFPQNPRNIVPGSVVIHEGVKSISDQAFCDTHGHGVYYDLGIWKVELPNSLEYIGARAFDSNNIQEITIPENVRYIGKDALTYNWIHWVEMKPIIPPEIDGDVFYYNHYDDDYTNVHVPAESFEQYMTAPGWCDITKRLYPYHHTYAGTQDNIDWSFCNGVLTMSKHPNAKDGIIPFWETCAWNNAWFAGHVKELVLNGGISVQERSFDKLVNLESITVNGNLVRGSLNAFDPNVNLKTITFTDKVTSIPDCCFYGCSTVTTVNLSKTIKSIGIEAFSRCSHLESITIPGSVKTIGNDAFLYCSAVGHIYFEDPSDLELGESVFCLGGGYLNPPTEMIRCIVKSPGNVMDGKLDNDPSSQVYWNVIFVYADTYGGAGIDGNIGWAIKNGTLTLEKDVSAESGEMNSYSYDQRPLWESDGNWETVSNVTIGSGVTSIGDYAFYSCKQLKELTLACDSSIERIGTSAFNNCSNLGEIIPESLSELRTIGDYAFAYCSKMYGGIDLSGCEKLTDIGMCAYLNCSNVYSISLPGSVKKIGGEAFAGCELVKSIRYYSDRWNIDSIGNRAFNLTEYGRCIVYSIDNCADHMLSDYGRSSFVYQNLYVGGDDDSDNPSADHTWFPVNWKNIFRSIVSFIEMLLRSLPIPVV